MRLGWGRRLFIALLLLAGVGVAVWLAVVGWEFYGMNLWERDEHPELAALRSSGDRGLLDGIIGTGLIVINLGYLLRRHVRALRRLGSLRTWMEVHVLTGLLGPLLVIFHSTFLFQTTIATTAAVALGVLVVTGIIGRHIYAQIPRTVYGAEAGPDALRERADVADAGLARLLGDDDPHLALARALASEPMPVPRSKIACLVLLPFISLRTAWLGLRLRRLARTIVRGRALAGLDTPSDVLGELQDVVLIRRRLHALETFRELMRWWRGLHRAFAIVMVAAVVIHITVATALGYDPLDVGGGR